MAEGFEPSTACLEGRCSIQLSYATISQGKIFMRFWEYLLFFKSGWQDSNLRPPRPKRGAITGLRYTPKPCNKVSNFQKKSGETGTRTLATVTRRQISNLLRYHSGTSPNTKCILRRKTRLQMYFFTT
jgi:hypothetical protein